MKRQPFCNELFCVTTAASSDTIKRLQVATINHGFGIEIQYYLYEYLRSQTMKCCSERNNNVFNIEFVQNVILNILM